MEPDDLLCSHNARSRTPNKTDQIDQINQIDSPTCLLSLRVFANQGWPDCRRSSSPY
jgi:hypothetical protein